MTVQTLVDQLLNLPEADRHAFLQQHPGVEGFSQEYFLRVAGSLGQDESVARALARDWELLADYGDEPSFAFRTKAIYERLQQDWAASAVSFQTAGKMATTAADRLAFQIGAIDSLARANRTDEARLMGEIIAQGLRDLGENALAGRAELNLGNACTWAERHAEAQEHYRRATTDLKGSPFLAELAAAQLGLSTVALFVDRPSVCKELAEASVAALMELGLEAYADHARVNEAQALMLCGQADQALRQLLSLRAKVEETSLEFARITQFMGDAYLRLQMFAMAERTYATALELPGLQGESLNLANAALGQAEAALAQGRLEAGQKGLLEALKHYRAAGNQFWIGYTSALSKGVLGDTSEAFQLAGSFRISGQRFWLARILGLLAEAQPDEGLISEWEQLITENGFMDQAWKPWAIRRKAGLGNPVENARKMIAAIVEHRAGLSSVVARLHLLEGHMEAVQLAMQERLQEDTDEARAEVIKWVAQLRSATLLDEIVLSARGKLAPKDVAELDRLRQDIQDESRRELPTDPLRRARYRPSSALTSFVSHLMLNEPAESTQEPALSSPPIMVQLPNEIVWLEADRVLRTGLSEATLRRRLHQIQLELFMPLVGLPTKTVRLEQALQQLRTDLRLSELETESEALRILPEGLGYQVPWPLLTDKEVIMALRPQPARPHDVHLASSARVAIWAHEREELPAIRAEVEMLQAIYPNAVVCRTIAEIRNSTKEGPFDLIHLAAHGHFHEENPMFSSVELGDGPLLACDIARMGLRAKLVVLSSCSSAGLGEATSAEPQGLARAFLACGAEAVVGTLWPLPDEIGLVAARSLHESLKSTPLVHALATARRTIKESSPHASAWGSLIIIQSL